MTEALLSEQDQEYFRTYAELFDHPGWKLFISEMQELVESAPEVAFRECKSMEQFLASKQVVNFVNEEIIFRQVMIESSKDAKIQAAQHELET